MRPWRVLAIAEAANPEWVSVPLVGWSLVSALRERARVHVVTQVRNRSAFLRAGLMEGNDFTVLDTEAIAAPVRRFAEGLRGGEGRGWTTLQAFSLPNYYYFERLFWRRFRDELRRGEWDIVHRVTPLSPTIPSRVARPLDSARVPFVVGPLNGGVPWPRHFDAARRTEREWLSYVRGAHRLLPGYRTMRRNAAALLIGSCDTLEQLGRQYRQKAIYIPENGVHLERFPERPLTGVSSRPLQVYFVGRLVPYKGADMLVEATAELARAGKVDVHLIGDGPQRSLLEALVNELGVAKHVHLHGWIEHERVGEYLRQADVLGFPSIREFGGGVVLEAMASGVPPIVVAYGGPGELVTKTTGVAIPLGSRRDIVTGFRRAIEDLARDPRPLFAMSRRARARVERYYTWSRKAEQIASVYDWVKGCAPKPDFGVPFPDAESSVEPGAKRQYASHEAKAH